MDTAKEQVRANQIEQAENDIRSRGFTHARVSNINIEYHKITYKHVLLPAWSSAFAYNGKQYMYIINGESGKVGGQRPYSIPKIVAAVAAAAAAITAAVILLTGAAAPPALQAKENAQPQAVVIQEDSPWTAWEDNL